MDTLAPPTGYYVIRCTGVGDAYGKAEPAGRYLASFDPTMWNADYTLGAPSTWSPRIADAIRFEDEARARACYDTPSPVGTDMPLHKYRVVFDHVPGRPMPPQVTHPEAQAAIDRLWLDGLL